MSTRVPLLGLLLLAFAGYFKATPIFRGSFVDLTLVGAGVVVVAIGARLGRESLRPRTGLVAVALLLFVGALGAASASLGTVYGRDKVLQVLILVPISVLGGSLLVKEIDYRRAWLGANVCLAGTMIVLGLVFPDPSASAFGRFNADGSTTILTARAIGAGFLVLVTLGLTGTRRWKAFMLAGLVFGGFMVASGSRGPAFAAICAVVAVVITLSRAGAEALVRAVLSSVMLVVAGFGWYVTGTVPQHLLSLESASSEDRIQMWRAAASVIWHHPFGVGWGDTFSYLPANLAIEFLADDSQHPHNLLLEVFAEAGWIGGLLTVGVLGVAVARQWRAATTPVESAMLALLLFQLGNAMASGDFHGNRGLWVAVGIALVASGRGGGSSEIGESQRQRAVDRPRHP